VSNITKHVPVPSRERVSVLQGHCVLNALHTALCSVDLVGSASAKVKLLFLSYCMYERLFSPQ